MFEKIKNNKFVQNLVHFAEENPAAAIMLTAALIGATAKLVDAIGHSAGSRAYAREVDARLGKKWVK